MAYEAGMERGKLGERERERERERYPVSSERSLRCFMACCRDFSVDLMKAMRRSLSLEMVVNAFSASLTKRPIRGRVTGFERID